jgi:hypothetical protein
MRLRRHKVVVVRRVGPPMPAKFEELARYNAQRMDGLVHTTEHKLRMAALQDEFNEWRKKAYPT